MQKDYYTIIEIAADASNLKLELSQLGLPGDRKFVDIGM